MARLTIPDEQTYAQFTVVNPTTVFPISFSLFAKTDLTVLVNGVDIGQAAFTFSGTVLESGGYDGGTVTLNTAVDDVVVLIERNVGINRASNFAPAAAVPVGSVDQALNRLTAIQQDQNRAKASRPYGRVGKFMAFDAEGNEVAASGTGGDGALRADLAASGGDALVSFKAVGTGAVVRTFGTKVRERGVSPQDFSTASIGNGVVDATDAFLKAIATGEDVFVPPTAENYKLSGLLTLQAEGQAIRGVGQLSRIIQTGANANATIFFVDGVDGVSVHDLWLTPGATTDTQLRGYAVYYRNAEQIVVEGLAVSGHRRGALLLQNCEAARVSRCQAFDSIVDSAVDDHSTSGIDFFVANGGRDIEIRNCSAIHGSGIGFAIQSQALPPGADPYVFDNIRVRDNLARFQGMYGFMAYRKQAEDVWGPVSFVGNQAQDITGATPHSEGDKRFGTGFYIQAVEGVEIIDNTAERCATETDVFTLAPAGFGWQNARVLGTVSGNTSLDSGQYGYAVFDPNGEGTGTPLTILGANIARNSRLDGFAFQSIPYPVISGGESIGSIEGSGLRVFNGGVSTATARSNINGLKCRGNAANGISIVAGSSVVDNVLAETSGIDGIQITATGKTHVVRNSRLVSNAARGLLAVAGSSRIETRNNQFEDNGSHIDSESPIAGLRSNTYVDGAGTPNAGNTKLPGTYRWIRTLTDGATPTIYAEEWVKSGGTTAITTVNGLAEGEGATFISAHTVTLLGAALTSGKVAQLLKIDGTVRVVGVSA